MSPTERARICANGFLKKDACIIMDGDYYQFPASCEKGNYQLFSVAGGPHQIEAIVHNIVLRDIAIPELVDTLRSIGNKIKAA